MELFDFRKKEYKEKMRYYFALQELWEKLGCRFVKSTKEMSLRFVLNMIWIMKIQ